MYQSIFQARQSFPRELTYASTRNLRFFTVNTDINLLNQYRKFRNSSPNFFHLLSELKTSCSAAKSERDEVRGERWLNVRAFDSRRKKSYSYPRAGSLSPVW